jgi:hypothetical protein
MKPSSQQPTGVSVINQTRIAPLVLPSSKGHPVTGDLDVALPSCKIAIHHLQSVTAKFNQFNILCLVADCGEAMQVYVHVYVHGLACKQWLFVRKGFRTV